MPQLPPDRDPAEIYQRIDRATVGQGWQTSDLGHDVRVWSKPSAQGPCFYLSAGIHGDEPAGPLALAALLESGDLDHRASWFVAPLLNPCGYRSGRREQEDGTDLNRDFKSLASPRVRAHVAWLDTLPACAMSISLHEDWEAKGFYLYEINTGAIPGFPDTILEAAAAHFPPDPGPEIDGHAITKPGIISHPPQADLPDQWPEAIHLAMRWPHLSYTFETPSSAPLDQRVRCLQAATRAAIAAYPTP